jgi:hypothetical protein
LLSKQTPQYLTRRILGYPIGEDEFLRNLVPGKIFGDEQLELLLTDLGTRPDDDISPWQFASVVGERNSHHSRVSDLRVLQEYALDLHWADLPAANLHEVFLPVYDENLVSLGKLTYIARAKPSVFVKGFSGRLFVVDISQHHRRAFHENVTRRALFGEQFTVVINNSILC